MIDFEQKITIQRPIKEVYTFLANLENIPKWNYYVTNVKKVKPGSVEVGAVYHQVRRTDEQMLKITTLEAEKTIGIKTEPGSALQLERYFRLDPVAQGTRILDQWKLDTGRSGLLEKLTAGKVRSAVHDNLMKLKELLESGQTVLQSGQKIELVHERSLSSGK